ncbi:MAG: PspA/IM30 family protein, partial [Rhodospirillales bacterium]|nr:PspA/IM30 family protein [Rhodospirillales bacterium]
MGIFSRLTDIINSNLNAILDRAEEPEKLIRLIIQEMEDTLVEVRSSAVKTIAERKDAERKVARLKAERDDWQAKAELALSKDREDLARGALVAKAKLSEHIAELDRHLLALDEGLQHSNEDISKLQAK